MLYEEEPLEWINICFQHRRAKPTIAIQSWGLLIINMMVSTNTFAIMQDIESPRRMLIQQIAINFLNYHKVHLFLMDRKVSMKRYRKYFFQSLSAIALGLMLMGSEEVPVFAQRQPVFTNDFGGTRISCSVYRKQVALNGVYAGESVEEVRQALGAPYYINRAQGTLEYHYSGGLSVSFADFSGTGDYTVFRIEASQSREGKMSTPDGVSVGMPETVLSDVYGTADAVWITKYISPKLPASDDEKNQLRCNKTTYVYHCNEGLSMSFVVQRGIITEIIIRQSE